MAINAELTMLEAYNNRALLVDLYELTMAAGYYEHQVDCTATFELFVRAMPPERGYLVAAGLDSALGYLENLRFQEDDVAFLRSLPAFRTVRDGFFDYLRGFRFTGEVWAMDEGTLVFAGEPILRVTAPVAQAQIAETYLLSVINYETLVASKAARVVHAAQGRPVWEFGTRRAQGPQAGVRAARAAYVGGCAGTSNVLAGYLYSVPLAGTAAHSWTQVFPDERQSFEALLETFPDTAILLIDTYDSLAGAENAASLGRKLAGVRLDSGDLLSKSRQVRDILDRHGMRETQIFASGDLNEYKVDELVRKGAPIDTYGVGTELATSRDVPALSVVYKLVEIERDGQVEYKTKFSQQKAHWPGRKQVFRFPDAEGKFHHDVVARESEHYAGGVPLLKPMMEGGRRLHPNPPTAELRARTLEGLGLLPERYHVLHAAPRHPVVMSAALERLLENVRDHYRVSEEAYTAARVSEDAHERIVFVDVDTQVDFMDPNGALYVPGAQEITPQLARLMSYAGAHGIPVLSSADAHPPDDPSFAQWPPHCVVGTPGQRRIAETQFPGALVIPNHPGAFHAPSAWPAQIIVEKQEYDASTNANFDAILSALGPARFVVFGVATEYCVRATALSLRQRGLPVDLVVDAIKPITEEGGQEAIEGMVAAGVRLVKVDDVCAPEPAVAPAAAR